MIMAERWAYLSRHWTVTLIVVCTIAGRQLLNLGALATNLKKRRAMRKEEQQLRSESCSEKKKRDTDRLRIKNVQRDEMARSASRERRQIM